jgi:TonB family protein
MTSKKLFFYAINFTAGLFLNIGLIVVITKNTSIAQAKSVPLIQRETAVTPPLKVALTKSLPIHISAPKISTSQESELQSRLSLEAELFYEKSQQLLSKFNQEIITSKSTSNNKYDNARGISPLHCYTKKTLDQIESFKKDLRRKYFPLIAKGPSVDKNPLLEVTINKNGSIASIFVTQSSGNKYFDKFWIQLFKKAAPFPSIPSYLHLNQLTVCT